MEREITIYRRTLESSHLIKIKNTSSNLPNYFIEMQYQLGRSHNSKKEITNSIEFNKFLQNNLTFIVSMNSPFRNFISLHIENHNLISNAVKIASNPNDEHQSKEIWIKPKVESSFKQYDNVQIRESSISKILKTLLVIVREYLTLTNDSVHSMEGLFTVFEDSIMDLPQPSVRQCLDLSLLSSVTEIKTFLYSLLPETVNIQWVSELTLLLFTKLGGLDNLLEWLHLLIKFVEVDGSQLRKDVLRIVLRSMLSGGKGDHVTEENMRYIDQCFGDAHSAGGIVSLKVAIDVIFNTILRVFTIEQNSDKDCTQCGQDVVDSPFSDIYIWNYGSKIDIVKSAYPNSLSARLNSSTQKPYNTQVICSQQDLMMVNNLGQVQSRSILKTDNSKEDSLKLSLSRCWSPIQFPDFSAKISHLCVGFANDEGNQHILALSTLGQLFSWGGGSHGKLGHGDIKDLKSPKRIESFRGYIVKEISAGMNHSAAVTETGISFVWGEGASFDDHVGTDCLVPKRLRQGIMSNVICGPHSTFMVCTKKRDITYIGSPGSQYTCYNDHFILPIHPSPIKWASSDGDSTVNTSNSQIIQKVVVNSSGLLILTAYGKLYSLGHGQILGCPNCKVHKFIERVKSMLDVYVLDVAISESHVIVLAQNVTYSWSLASSTFTIVEESLSCFVTNVSCTHLMADNSQINIAWYKKDKYHHPALKSPEKNFYLYSTSPGTTLTHFTDILSQCSQVLDMSIFSERTIHKTLELLINFFKSDRLSDTALDSVNIEVSNDLMEVLVRIYDRSQINRELITNAILNSTKTLYHRLEDSAKLISKVLSPIKSLSSLSNGYQLLLETLLLRFDYKCGSGQFVKLYDLNLRLLDNLLITICHILTSDVIAVVQEQRNDKGPSIRERNLTYLTTILNNFSIYGYRAFLKRVQEDKSNTHNPVSNFCSLLPMINSVIGCLKSLLSRYTQTTKILQWISSLNAKFINTLFADSPVGWIQFDILFFLLQEEHNEDICPLIPHVSSMIITLNDINCLLPNTATVDAQEVNFPLQGFSSSKYPASSIPESATSWVWLLDLQRMSGLLYGKLLNTVIKSVNLIKDERVCLQTPLRKYICQLQKRPKFEEPRPCLLEENYARMIKILTSLDSRKYSIWSKGNGLYSTGLQIYTTIIILIRSKWNDAPYKNICTLFDVPYICEKLINSTIYSLNKVIGKDLSVEDYTLDEQEISRFRDFISSVNEKCSYLQKVLMESTLKSENQLITTGLVDNRSLKSEIVETRHVAKRQQSEIHNIKSRSKEHIHQIIQDNNAINNGACIGWLLEIYQSLLEFILSDSSLSVLSEEIANMSYNILVKKTKSSRAFVTLESINRLFDEQVMLLDSVFIQIFNGLLVSPPMTPPDSKLSDDQLIIVKRLFVIVLSKLKICTQLEDYKCKPQRMCISLLSFICQYNLMNGEIIKMVTEFNTFSLIMELVAGSPFISTDKWLIIDGNGDLNMTNVSNAIAWCTLDDLLCNLSFLGVKISEDVQKIIESKIISNMEHISNEIIENSLTKIFDLYLILKSSKMLFEKSNFFCRHLRRLVDILLRITTIEADQDSFSIFYSKYALNIAALDFLSIVLCKMMEQKSVLLTNDLFKNLFEKFGKYFLYLMTSNPKLQAERLVNAVEWQIDYFDHIKSPASSAMDIEWVSRNSNFDDSRTFGCDLSCSDKIFVSPDDNELFMGVNLEVMDSGVWEVIMDVSSGDHNVEFSYGFLINDKDKWPTDYQSLMNLKKIMQSVSLSGKGSVSERIQCVIDINGGFISFHNVKNNIQTFNSRKGEYRFFVSFSTHQKYVPKSFQIQLVSVKQKLHSDMSGVDNVYTNSVICQDHYIVRARLYDTVALLCERNPEIIFRYFVIPLSQQMVSCNNIDEYLHQKTTNLDTTAAIIFSLFLLCGISNEHHFYRGEMCTYLSPQDYVVNDGVIIDFETKIDSKFAGLNFVEKLVDDSEIDCLVYSLGLRSLLRIPLQALIKDEKYKEGLLQKYLKDIFPDYLEDLTTLLLNLSRCISSNYFNVEITNYEEESWSKDSSDSDINEYKFVKCLSTDLFLQILSSNEMISFLFNTPKSDIQTKLDRIVQNVIKFSTQPSPMINVSKTEDFLCCSWKLIEGFHTMQEELNLGLPRKYASLYTKSSPIMCLSKKERKVLVRALKRMGYCTEIIESLINNQNNQLSPMGGQPVTFSLRRRLVDNSLTSDQIYLLPTPANEFDVTPQAAEQIQEMDPIISHEMPVNQQSTIHDFFAIQSQKKRTSRICPICDLVLKSDEESLYSHLSLKHARNCGKQFQHQATIGIDLHCHSHDLDLETLHCATVTDKFYSVCCDFVNRKVLNKDTSKTSKFCFENFMNECYQLNPLIGWSGTLSTEEYFYQPTDAVKIKHPVNRPEVGEVGVLGENIANEVNESKSIFNPATKDETLTLTDNDVCDMVPFVCQLNSNAIVTALIRLEYTNIVLTSRKIVRRLIKMIFRSESRLDVSRLMQRFLLNDLSFTCDIIRMVEFGRIQFDISRYNVSKDIQTSSFCKEDFLATFVMALESDLDNSNKVHKLVSTFIATAGKLLRSTSEYFRLSKDTDKAVLICPSRLLTQILCNISIRVLSTKTFQDLKYQYWQENVESVIEILAFGAINNLCGVRDKVWCIHNLVRLFEIIERQKPKTDVDAIFQADLCDDLSTEETQIVHITNINIKKYITTKNRKNVLTADDVGTVRIWDIGSKLGFMQHLQQTLIFGLEGSDNIDLFNKSDNIAPDDILRTNLGEYLLRVGAQRLAVSANGMYVGESIGVYLNIWSLRSVYSQSQLITFSDVVTVLIFPELTFSGLYGAPVDQLLVGLSNGQLFLLRILDNGSRITQKPLKMKEMKENVSMVAAAWDSERNAIVIGYSDGSILLTDQRMDAECTVLGTLHNRPISQLQYCPYTTTFEKYLLASSSVGENQIGIWSGDRILCAITLDNPVTCLEWLSQAFVRERDSYVIISGDAKGLIQFWGFNTPVKELKNLISFNGHLCDITTLRMSDKGSLLVSGCRNGWVNVWCTKDRTLLRTFRGAEVVIAADWTPDSNLVVAWAGSQYLDIWYNFNEAAFQKNGLRQWAHIRDTFLKCTEAKSVKHLDNLKKLTTSITRLIIQQYNDEVSFIKCGYSIVFSIYIQTLIQFVLSLGLLPTLLQCHKSYHMDVTIDKHLPIPRRLANDKRLQRRAMCHILNRNDHFQRINDNYLDWLFDVDELVQITRTICFNEDAPKEIIPMWWWNWCFESDDFAHQYYHSRWGNEHWSWEMQSELNEWFVNYPGDWIANYGASTLVWGCGKSGELNMITKKDWERPVNLSLDGVHTVVCGSSLTLVITHTGNLMACGEGLEIVFNPYFLREESLRMIIVPILADFKITQVSASRGPESHIIAITSFGDVYSWGVGHHGKLGHGHSTSLKKPKLIEALRGKCAIQADCGHKHSAVVTSYGKLFTFGGGAVGQLGLGSVTESDTPRLVAFEDDDVKIGYVACGASHTLALSHDGSELYAFGEGGFGQLGVEDLTNHFTPSRVDLKDMKLLKVVCGSGFSAALTEKGEVLSWGHSHYVGLEEPEGDEVKNVPAPTLIQHFVDNGLTMLDLSAGNDVMFAVSSTGLIYGWGTNNSNLLLSSPETHIYLPRLVNINSMTNFKQISCGRHHASASSYSPPTYRYDLPSGPVLLHNGSDSLDSSRYPALAASGLNRFDLTARLILLLYWNELVRLTWQLWLPLTNQKYATHNHNCDNASKDWPLVSPQSYLLPECDWSWNPFDHFRSNEVRCLLNKDFVNNALYQYIACSMITNRAYSSLVKINRIEKTEAVFIQACYQVLEMYPMELRLPWRAWKVKLIHEGADDAGGAYDETISQMCNELQSPDSQLDILSPSPNDNTLFLPNSRPHISQKYFIFLGVLMGAAVRTKKPIDLNLDPIYWKLITKSSISIKDLLSLDVAYFSSLMSLMSDDHYEDEYLKEVLSLDNFVVFSANGAECEIQYRGLGRRVTAANVSQYAHQAISYRLHEFDKCVAFIREGFARVCPLIFLDLITWSQLERDVCGARTIDVSVLKSIARYVDTDDSHEIFQWFWLILAEFTELEKSQFLRFVTGKSRLPSNIYKIPFRLFIYLSKKPPTSLPEAQTCFNQIRLPRYASRGDLASRLRLAIGHCRSIDMDDYMLLRNRDTH